MPDRLPCIGIMGATATGKSDLAIHLAHRLQGEIISMDSRQVYRGMDIGTAKVLPEDREGIPHHLIDILDPSEPNSAGAHARRALTFIKEIRGRENVPILAGGTGLYFRALFHGLADIDIPQSSIKRVRDSLAERATDDLYAELETCDPERAATLSPNDRQRISRALEVFHATGTPMTDYFHRQIGAPMLAPVKLVLTMPRAALRDRITLRTRMMFDAGWIDEVKRLIARGYSSRSPGLATIGYKEIAEALETGGDLSPLCDRITTLTHQYAKRQETFFRKEEGAAWFDVLDPMMQRKIERGIAHAFHFKNNLT